LQIETQDNVFNVVREESITFFTFPRSVCHLFSRGHDGRYGQQRDSGEPEKKLKVLERYPRSGQLDAGQASECDATSNGREDNAPKGSALQAGAVN
jgi:hypothetical protein